MRIIQFQKSYNSVMLKKLMSLALVLLGLLVFIYLFVFVLPVFVPILRYYWWIIFPMGLLAFAIIEKYLEPLKDEIENFRSGKTGEEAVADMLKETLDDNYIYIQNYTIPNTRIGDIDGLLIGPKGVIVLEAKNYVGIFRISGGDMLRRLRGDIYKLYRRSPFRQVMRQTKYLERFFKDKGLNVRVIPIVVLVAGKISAISGTTGVFVTEINKLTNHIFELSSIPNWSAELSNKIIAALNLQKSVSAEQ